MGTPPPPPNIPTGQASDPMLLRSIVEWMWSFYKTTVKEGYFAQTSEVQALSNLIDPTSATAASAQATANSALSLATVNDGRLNDIKAGTVTVSGTATAAAASFATAFADTAYYVAYGVESVTGAPASGSYTPSGTAKTVNDLTLSLLAAPGAGNAITYNWIAVRPQ